jgi:hypothetical protein
MVRRDFVAFVHRAFCDPNPQTRSLPASHIELMASRFVNLPPRSLKSTVFRSTSSRGDAG